MLSIVMVDGCSGGQLLLDEREGILAGIRGAENRLRRSRFGEPPEEPGGFVHLGICGTTSSTLRILSLVLLLRT